MSILPYQAAISKWDMHKNQAIRMSERLCAAGAAAGRKDIWLRGDIMKDCSQRIEYTYCPDCGSMHLRRTNLCRDRLCPLCAWRLSLQRIGDMLQVIDYMTQQRGAQLSAAMLTLTVKNCPAKELGATIGQMLKAWDRLIKRRKVAKWVSGYARSIEVTRAKNGEYHPHIHTLLIWADGYTRQTIPQTEWVQLWEDSMRLSYKPIVDIRTSYGRTQENSAWDSLVRATVEATKYTIKGIDLLTIPAPDLIDVADALKGRRLISYGGSVKAARAALKICDDDTAADVTDTAIECPKCGYTDTVQLAYTWAQESGSYLLAPWPYSV